MAQCHRQLWRSPDVGRGVSSENSTEDPPSEMRVVGSSSESTKAVVKGDGGNVSVTAIRDLLPQ